MDRLERPSQVVYREDRFAKSFVLLIIAAMMALILYGMGGRQILWISLAPFLFGLSLLFFSRALVIDRNAGRALLIERRHPLRTSRRELVIGDLSVRAEIIDDMRPREGPSPMDGARIWLDVREASSLLFERCDVKEEARARAERLAGDLGRPCRIERRVIE